MTDLTPLITTHAVRRYQQRVAPVTDDEAREALSCKGVRAAIAFGAEYVRLGTGHRVVIEDGMVVTVLTPDHRIPGLKPRITAS